MVKLARLTAYEVRVTLPKPLLLGAIAMREREYVMAEVEDEHGLRGYGVALTRDAPVGETIRRLIEPRWVGRSLDDYPVLYDETLKAHRFLGTNGIYWRAISLVDCAVHDLLAKAAGVPLCVYLGGKIQPVAVTLAGCYPTQDETPETLASLMADMERYGAAGIKITSSSDYARDTERLRICREALQSPIPFINDLYSQVPDVQTLLPWAQRWGELNMLWLEDPFWFDEFDAMAELARQLPYPVAVGDEQSGLTHFEHLMHYGQIGIVRLDATVCGGVTGFRRIARAAEERGRYVSSHIFHHLHVHLAAAIPNVRWIEYMLPQAHIDGFSQVVTNDLRWEQGHLVPDDVPGVQYVWGSSVLEQISKGR